MLMAYSIIVAMWVYNDAKSNQVPKWWALGVLVLPILTPWYFAKARHHRSYWKLMGWWCAGFVLFQVVGTTFYGK
jgi:hypothetical protein